MVVLYREGQCQAGMFDQCAPLPFTDVERSLCEGVPFLSKGTTDRRFSSHYPLYFPLNRDSPQISYTARGAVNPLNMPTPSSSTHISTQTVVDPSSQARQIRKAALDTVKSRLSAATVETDADNLLSEQYAYSVPFHPRGELLPEEEEEFRPGIMTHPLPGFNSLEEVEAALYGFSMVGAKAVELQDAPVGQALAVEADSHETGSDLATGQAADTLNPGPSLNTVDLSTSQDHETEIESHVTAETVRAPRVKPKLIQRGVKPPEGSSDTSGKDARQLARAFDPATDATTTSLSRDKVDTAHQGRPDAGPWQSNWRSSRASDVDAAATLTPHLPKADSSSRPDFR